MKYYAQLVDLGCFTRNNVEAMTGNRETAHSVIESYKKKGLIESVRRDLFVVISLETKQPVPNRYVIASHAAPGAYVSHHSAFEYHGLANQVYYEVCVAAKTRFRTFEHDGLTYRHITSPFINGVENRKDGVRVTDLERTVIDGIKDFEKIGGLEELLRCIGLAPHLDQSKLLEYLSAYGNTFLYQKSGYILEHYKEALKLSESFFAACRAKTSKSKRYLYKKLLRETHTQNRTWSLYVPNDLMAFTRKGIDPNA